MRRVPCFLQCTNTYLREKKTELRSQKKKPSVTYRLQQTLENTVKYTLENSLLNHATLGCDSVSLLYEVGKYKMIKKFTNLKIETLQYFWRAVAMLKKIMLKKKKTL